MRLRYPASIAMASIVFSIPSFAYAQFGSIGKAIKKKAAEVAAEAVVGKGTEEPKTPASSGNARGAAEAKGPRVLEISADVMTRFTTALTAEAGKREAGSKRSKCVEGLPSHPEMIKIEEASLPALAKISDSQIPDEKKGEEIAKIMEQTQNKRDAFALKQCGPVVETLQPAQIETAAAEAGGFSFAQYSILKERILAYCEAAARGMDNPTDTRLVITDAEKQVVKARCPSTLALLKKVT